MSTVNSPVDPVLPKNFGSLWKYVVSVVNDRNFPAEMLTHCIEQVRYALTATVASTGCFNKRAAVPDLEVIKEPRSCRDQARY